jgi:RNA polymerase sigma factor (sigma-70 family)
LGSLGVDTYVIDLPTDHDSSALSRDLTALYRTEWGRLVRLAYLMTGSQPTAEEIAQEAFVHLQEARAVVVNPAGYLRTTVVNACRSYHRHQAVVERSPVRRIEPVLAEHHELFDALSRLSERQRAAVVMRFHLDLSESDIASALGCRPSTVRSITARALTALRKELT